MAIAFGSVGTLYQDFNETTNTKSFTLTAGRQLVVGVAYYADVNITSATWNTSEALTAVGSEVAQGTRFLQMYALDGGTSGTHDVVIVFDGDPNICSILCADYSGIATGTEFEGAAAGNGASNTPLVTVTGVAASSLAIGFFANGGDNAMSGMSAVSGTIRAKLDGVSGAGMALLDNTETAGSAALSGTLGGSDNWMASAAEFLEAGGGGGLLIPIADRYYAQLRGE